MKRTIPFFALIIAISLFFACTEEAPVSPVIDHIAPAVEWLAPVSCAELSGSVELSFSVYDAGGIDCIRVYINGSLFGEGGHSCPPNCSDTLLTLPWNTEEVPDGVHILEARAWDDSGNLGISPSLLVEVKNHHDPNEDRLPPDVWWVSPDGGSTLSGTVSLQVRFFDESSIDSVRLLKNGAAVANYIPPGSRGGSEGGVMGDTITHIWNTLTDSDGVYIWEARAWDASGNLGISPSLLVRVRNNEEPPPEDRTPPVVTWLSPEPGSTVEGVVELRFQALDDVGLDSVKVYLNGRIFEKLESMGNFLDGEAIWITSDYPDGNYIVEVRAWDSAGNMGAGVGVVLTVMNNVPRVIYVPDDYETIQEAINASENGDTVRVREGVYREGLRMMGKEIWLESELGPDVTIIDASVEAFGIRVQSNEDSTLMIRGFTITSANYDGISTDGISSPRIYNCIIKNSQRNSIRTLVTHTTIANCIFDGSGSSNVDLFAFYGNFINNIITNSDGVALWNSMLYENPILIEYSLIWNYEELLNEPPLRLGENNLIDIDPLFIDEFYYLSPSSPCIDGGHPEVEDLDGSRSDIGAYGGPLAYPPQ